jgi:hypothetical protein
MLPSEYFLTKACASSILSRSSHTHIFAGTGFNILGKLSEVLYEVDCGRNNEPQIIHCDRLKRKVKQRLRGESERDTDPVEIDREEVAEDIRPEVGSEIVPSSSGGRTHKLCHWLQNVPMRPFCHGMSFVAKYYPLNIF